MLLLIQKMDDVVNFLDIFGICTPIAQAMCSVFNWHLDVRNRVFHVYNGCGQSLPL